MRPKTGMFFFSACIVVCAGSATQQAAKGQSSVSAGTEKIGGEKYDTQDAELSPDGKTLTMTVHLPSQSKPKVYVFDRE